MHDSSLRDAFDFIHPILTIQPKQLYRGFYAIGKLCPIDVLRASYLSWLLLCVFVLHFAA